MNLLNLIRNGLFSYANLFSCLFFRFVGNLDNMQCSGATDDTIKGAVNFIDD